MYIPFTLSLPSHKALCSCRRHWDISIPRSPSYPPSASHLDQISFCSGHLDSFLLSTSLSSWSAAAAKLLQSCPTLCDPIDSSPPGSPAPGILQARTLEWVAISFSESLPYLSSNPPHSSSFQEKCTNSSLEVSKPFWNWINTVSCQSSLPHLQSVG